MHAQMDGLSRWIQDLHSDPSPQSRSTIIPGSVDSLERLICRYDDVLIAVGWEPVAIKLGTNPGLTESQMSAWLMRCHTGRRETGVVLLRIAVKGSSRTWS